MNRRTNYKEKSNYSKHVLAKETSIKRNTRRGGEEVIQRDKPSHITHSLVVKAENCSHMRLWLNNKERSTTTQENEKTSSCLPEPSWWLYNYEKQASEVNSV